MSGWGDYPQHILNGIMGEFEGESLKRCQDKFLVGIVYAPANAQGQQLGEAGKLSKIVSGKATGMTSQEVGLSWDYRWPIGKKDGGVKFSIETTCTTSKANEHNCFGIVNAMHETESVTVPQFHVPMVARTKDGNADTEHPLSETAFICFNLDQSRCPDMYVWVITDKNLSLKIMTRLDRLLKTYQLIPSEDE